MGKNNRFHKITMLQKALDTNDILPPIERKIEVEYIPRMVDAGICKYCQKYIYKDIILHEAICG